MKRVVEQFKKSVLGLGLSEGLPLAKFTRIAKIGSISPADRSGGNFLEGGPSPSHQGFARTRLISKWRPTKLYMITWEDIDWLESRQSRVHILLV